MDAKIPPRRVANSQRARRNRADVLAPTCAGLVGTAAAAWTHVTFTGELLLWLDWGVIFASSAACFTSVKFAWRALMSTVLDRATSEERVMAFLGALFVGTVFALEVVRLAAPGVIHG